MNVNLGAHYEKIIRNAIGSGRASSQTEVLRQALLFYDDKMEEDEIGEDEARLVYKGIQKEMEKIRSGKEKTYTLKEVKRKLGI